MQDVLGKHLHTLPIGTWCCIRLGNRAAASALYLT